MVTAVWDFFVEVVDRNNYSKYFSLPLKSSIVYQH